MTDQTEALWSKGGLSPFEEQGVRERHPGNHPLCLTCLLLATLDTARQNPNETLESHQPTVDGPVALSFRASCGCYEQRDTGSYGLCDWHRKRNLLDAARQPSVDVEALREARLDRVLTPPHRDDDQPCACDECMSYGAEDVGADWYRIPPVNRIVMRILDSGDDRFTSLRQAFRDHEAALAAQETPHE